jgi:uncharacterized integral membrane protein
VSGDFFDRLEADLAGLARHGTHIEMTVDRARRRVVTLFRRGAVILLLAVVLATSLVSEFPASANGRPLMSAVGGLHGF